MSGEGLIGRVARRHGAALLALGGAAIAARAWRQSRRDAAEAARQRRLLDEPPPPAELPAISALVAAWNEADGIEEHLRSFAAMALPGLELIICAGGGDGTLELARRWSAPNVTVLEQAPGEGKQRALARCFAHAAGELIYLTDADCRFDAGALRHLAAALGDGCDAATGDSRPLASQRGRLLAHYVWAADAWAASHAPAEAQGLLGRNALIRRAAIEASGGMEFAAPTGTDYHLARRLLRAGCRIRHVPQSSVASRYPETLRVYWNKQARWLRNLLVYGPGYGAYHQVADALRSAAVGGAMLALTGAALRHPAARLLWGLLLAQAAAARWRYARFLLALHGAAPPPGYAAALPALALADCAIWLTPVAQALLPRYRHRW